MKIQTILVVLEILPLLLMQALVLLQQLVLQRQELDERLEEGLHELHRQRGEYRCEDVPAHRVREGGEHVRAKERVGSFRFFVRFSMCMVDLVNPLWGKRPQI